MQTIRLSTHADESIWLRQRLIEQRQALGLSQRALAERLGVVYSFVGKVETGDRRLDVYEFIAYCRALEVDAREMIKDIMQQFDL